MGHKVVRTSHKIIAYSRQGRTRQWRDRKVQHGLSRPGGTWRCRHSRCPSPLSGPGPADLPDLCQPWYDLGGPAGLLTVPGTRPATSPLPALPTARAGQVLPACSDFNIKSHQSPKSHMVHFFLKNLTNHSNHPNHMHSIFFSWPTPIGGP